MLKTCLLGKNDVVALLLLVTQSLTELFVLIIEMGFTRGFSSPWKLTIGCVCACVCVCMCVCV